MDVVGAPNPQDLEGGFEKLWVADVSPGGVTAVDTHYLSISRRVDIDDTIAHIVMAADTVWAGGEQALYEIDPDTMQTVRTVPFEPCGNCTNTYQMAGNGDQIAVTIPHRPVVAVGDGTNWTAYGIDQPVALAMTQADLWVAGARPGPSTGSISPGNAGLQPHEQVMCNTSRVSGDFDGDGRDDIVSDSRQAITHRMPIETQPGGLVTDRGVVAWHHQFVGATKVWDHPAERSGNRHRNV